MNVAENFNSLCIGGQRSLSQLKTQWVATKVLARKTVASHRKEVFKTGGGAQPVNLNLSGDDICVWLPNEFVVDENEFDSDALKVILQEDEESNSPGTVQSHVVESYPPITQKRIEILQEAERATSTETIEDSTKIPAKEKKTVQSSKKFKKINKEATNVTAYNINKLTTFDMECKKELHELQLETEKKEFEIWIESWISSKLKFRIIKVTILVCI